MTVLSLRAKDSQRLSSEVCRQNIDIYFQNQWYCFTNSIVPKTKVKDGITFISDPKIGFLLLLPA